MHELALFAGAGGGILGGKLCGWKTVCAVEIDGNARSVLLARQNERIFKPFPVWDDIRTFDGRPWRGLIDVVSGGFPCQDISCAGKGAGIKGSRSGLWSEMARIIGEVRPRFVFVENSTFLRTRGLGVVLGELAQVGYDAQWCFVSAENVGAPHKRDRLWLVAPCADSDGRGCQIQREQEHGEQQGAQRSELDGLCQGRSGSWPLANPLCDGTWERFSQVSKDTGSAEVGAGRGEGAEFGNGRQDVPDTERQCIDTGAERTGRETGADACGSCPWAEVADTEEQHRAGYERETHEPGRGGEDVADSAFIVERKQTDEENPKSRERKARPESRSGSWWESEPDVGRVAHGVANRVDRLKCLGNGQVPAVAATAWRILTEGI
jgi:DNA (cytosine-5)-methyltransferase 1